MIGLVRGVRFHARDAHGVIGATTRWVGRPANGTIQVTEIPVGDSITSMEVEWDDGGTWRYVTKIVFRTRLGLTIQSGNDNGMNSRAYTFDSNHEFVGLVGGSTGALVAIPSIGPIVRPRAALIRSIGEGCRASSTGLSVALQVDGAHSIGNSTELRLSGAPASAIGAIVLSAVEAPVRIGACTLEFEPHFVPAISFDANGTASYSVPIPVDWSLIGSTLFAQGFVAETGGPVLGVGTFTNGVGVTLGAM